MNITVKTTCPLGSTCEKIGEGVIERCAWYVKLQGKNPQDGSDIDEWKCAMAWQPLLMVESTSVASNVNASIQSMRNETVKRQDIALETINVKVLESK